MRRSGRARATAPPPLPRGVRAGLQSLVEGNEAMVREMLSSEADCLVESLARVMGQQQLTAEQLLARFFGRELLGEYCVSRLGKSGKGGVGTLAARIAREWGSPDFAPRAKRGREGDTASVAKRRAPGPVLGVNYEAGKGIRAARLSEHCRGAYGIQIAMDAPFQQGSDSQEAERARGRTEVRLGGEEVDSSVRAQLAPVVAKAAAACGDDGRLIVQVARGRSAAEFYGAVVRPVLDGCGVRELVLATGYRSTDLPDFARLARPFVYLNVGMFGRLSPDVAPGRAFAVATSLLLDPASTPANPAVAGRLLHADEDDALGMLPHCVLAACPDAFPFVTPELYDQGRLMRLFAEGE